MPYPPGTILLNKYRIDALIGQGAFGDVYRATHLQLNQMRAIKVLRRDTPGIGSQDYNQISGRFRLEAQLGVRLDHPNVIKVYDYEENQGELCLVMEYAPGGSLQEKLSLGVLPIEAVVRLGAELCAGLDAIHNQLHAIHRDIKPSNILFGADGRAKIADLGLAQIENDASRRSQLGSLAGRHPGTPLYMSPEQENTSAYLLPTSDVFSVGCVLFEALTGKKYKSVYGSRVRDHRAEVPVWLDEIVARALAEQPGRVIADDADVAKRFRDTRFMLNSLKKGWSASKASLVVQPVAPPIVPNQNLIRDVKQADARLWRKEYLFVAALIPILIMGLAIGYWLQTSNKIQNNPTPSLTFTVTEHPTVAPTLAPWPDEIIDDRGATMRLVPAAEFIMGSYEGDGDEKPVHRVMLDAFYMDKYEVTNKAYQACMDWGVCSSLVGTGSFSRGRYFGDPQYDNFPVLNVNWYQAKAFCEWRGARLPTEAEWEKAARGTDGRTYPWGEGMDCQKANHNGCAGDTTPVGSYPMDKSPYGIFDMAGNVGEWVADWYDVNYYSYSPRTNPLGPETGEMRSFRAGAWGDSAYLARSAVRNRYIPESADAYVGFRCARSAPLISLVPNPATPAPSSTPASIATLSPTLTMSPVPSPTLVGGGSGKIAFSLDSYEISSTDGIYVVNVDGSNPVQLIEETKWGDNTPIWAEYPVWSPDGQQIVFLSNRDTKSAWSDIFLMNLDGSNQRKLNPASAKYRTRRGSPNSATWSPDGQRIAFSGYYTPGPYLINVDGSSLIQLAEQGETPVWSPDGSQIAFCTDSSVNIINVDGTNLRNIASTSSFRFPKLHGWALAANKLILSQYSTTHIEIYAIDINDGNVLKLGNGAEPHLSPDGQKIAYQCQPTAGASSYSSICVMNNDGSGNRILVEGHRPAWSPDGQKIAFVAEGSVFIMDESGENSFKVFNGDPDSYPWPEGIAWAP